MSKMIVSQKMQMTCEGCGKTQEWELVSNDPVEAKKMVDEMSKWFIVGRKAVVDGQMVSLSADACSLDCVNVAAVKLMLPREQPVEDQIDLAALQNNRVQ